MSDLEKELREIDALSPEQIQSRIDACHPCKLETDEAYQADFVAMKLIQGRHEKREIVNLLRWLLMGRPELTAAQAEN